MLVKPQNLPSIQVLIQVQKRFYSDFDEDRSGRSARHLILLIVALFINIVVLFIRSFPFFLCIYIFHGIRLRKNDQRQVNV